MKLKMKPLFFCLSLLPAVALASSHREAPFISTLPQMDASDFYMFMSYEPGRQGYVTLLANYNPLQDPTGGPNFFPLNDKGYYDFNIDTDGSGHADLTFRFKFTNTYKNLTVPAGGQAIAVPLLNIGPVSATNQANLNRIETYTLQVRRGDADDPVTWQPVVTAAGSAGTFTKPVDDIGQKSIAQYANYADSYVYDVVVPGCPRPGRVFVGQRKDGFVVNVGEIFDLVNLNPLGPRDGGRNALTHKDVTTLALELPASCLTGASNPVIGGWTTSSMASSGGNYVQVSRLGQPLVNELVIGLKDKDRFNGSMPSNDAQFLKYVTNPSVPVLLHALFGTQVPQMPRNDLVSVYLTGVKGLNQPMHVTPAEELRLNTSIKPTPPQLQNDLGVLGHDLAGFPNGRRPYDDVVDITLRVAEGALCGAVGSCGNQTSDPNHGAPFTDGARSPGPTAATEHVTGNENPADTYLGYFPYLMPPLPGAPNGVNGLPAN